MTANPRIIPTVYKGYRFRSRLEARWAVFLDGLALRWEYEWEGYRLDDQSLCLPDFWLPESELWLEVKGEVPTDRDVRRARQLRDASGRAVMLFSGVPCDRPREGSSRKDPVWEFLRRRDDFGVLLHKAALYVLRKFLLVENEQLYREAKRCMRHGTKSHIVEDRRVRRISFSRSTLRAREERYSVPRNCSTGWA